MDPAAVSRAYPFLRDFAAQLQARLIRISWAPIANGSCWSVPATAMAVAAIEALRHCPAARLLALLPQCRDTGRPGGGDAQCRFRKRELRGRGRQLR